MNTSVGDMRNLVLKEIDRLSIFCQQLLANLSRSDQRRWGEIYVRGLISVPGRKSIRRISDSVVGGRADQGLQQFVNQSPWKWESVRQALAEHLTSLYRPQAWVVDEVVFPKNGSNSVGVARQYAPAAGRVLNCQVGIGVFLLGDGGASPVNWRLLLPQEWDSDASRRAASHVPHAERHRTRWGHVLDALDEMISSWELAPAPVVVDARHDTNVEPLLRGLDERGLRFVVQVAAGTPTMFPSADGGGRTATAGEVAAMLARGGGTTLNWHNGVDGPAAVSRFVVQSLARSAKQKLLRRWPRQLLAEWVPGDQRPNGLWLTNLNVARMPELINLARARGRAAQDVTRLQDDFGLGHFEGRSFRGWHHHVTLVSLAHAYALGLRLGEHGGDVPFYA
jgi:SRSO17 transposase